MVAALGSKKVGVVKITDALFDAVVEIKGPGQSPWVKYRLKIRAYINGDESQLVVEDDLGNTGDLLLTDKMAGGKYAWEKLHGDKTKKFEVFMSKSINDEFLVWLDRQGERGIFDVTSARFV